MVRTSLHYHERYGVRIGETRLSILVPYVTTLTPHLGIAVLDTAAVWLAAVALAGLAGFALGLALRGVRRVAMILVGFPLALPAITLAPIVLALHGSALVVGAFGACWPILWHTVHAQPDDVRADVVRAYRVSRWRAFWWVTVPAASAALLAGLRCAAPIALASVLGTEVLSGKGLGGYLGVTARTGDVAAMIGAIAITGLIGLLIAAPLDIIGHGVTGLDNVFDRVRWLVLVCSLLFWQGIAWLAHDRFFPTPLMILVRARVWWSVDVLVSAGRLAAGWGLAAVVGVAAGLLLRSVTTTYGVGALSFLVAVPPVALVPVFLAMNHGGLAEISAIAAGSVWPVLAHTAEAVRAVDPITVQTARVFRVPHLYVRVVLRAAAPRMFAGLRIGLARAITVLLLAELLGTGGIGHRLSLALAAGDLTAMWAWLVLAWVLSAVSRRLLVALARRVNPLAAPRDETVR